MRLASLNCPNCNAPLREENEKFICTACGSAFALDYDESDVEHERLRTEAERERIKTQRDIELMATRMQLEEEAKARQLQRAREERSSMMRSSLSKMLIIPVVMIAVSAVTFIMIVLIGHRSMKNTRSKMTSMQSTAAETQAPQEKLGREEILGDTSFTENALGSGASFAKSQHSDAIRDWNLMAELGLHYVPEAKLDGEPKLLNVYFVDGGRANYFIMVYELNFAYNNDEIDRTITVYFADYLAGISLTESGKIRSDFDIKRDFGPSRDMYFDAYYDLDQLYREAVLGKGSEVIDMTSDLVPEA